MQQTSGQGSKQGRRSAAWLLWLSATVLGCAAAGAGGGSGGEGYPGGAPGSPCAVEGQAGCSFADGHALTQACIGGAWVVQSTCAAGAFCSIAAGGAAQCGSPAAQNQADSGTTTGDTPSPGGGSAGDAGSTGSATDTKIDSPPLVAQGSFTAKIDGGTFTVDYTGMEVQAAMVHRQNQDPGGEGCVASLALSVAMPDGSCRLEVALSAGYEGQGLRIDDVRFYAKTAVNQDGTIVSTLPCASWTSEPAAGEVVYQGVNPAGGMLLPPIPQPGAGQATATLSNQLLAVGLDAPVSMKFLGRKFDLDLSSLSFVGEVVSSGDPNASCAKQAYPLPKWTLVDMNPGSAGYKNQYGLDAFKGKKIVVALVSDWCNSCRAQSQLMQKLQDQALASGHSDVQMVLIADKQKSDLSQLTKLIKNIPLFLDTAAVDAWGKMNAPHAGKFKSSEIRNSGYGFAKNGKEIMYFAPSGNGSLNLTAFQQAVMTVVNAAD